MKILQKVQFFENSIFFQKVQKVAVSSRKVAVLKTQKK